MIPRQGILLVTFQDVGVCGPGSNLKFWSRRETGCLDELLEPFVDLDT